MYLLNYLYFIIITSFGIKFLFQRAGKVRHPLNKEQMLSFDGPELFWTLTFSTGLLAFSAPGVLDLMAIRLLVLESLCLIGLFVVKRKPVWSAVSTFYLLYIAWLLIGLSYSPAPMYGFRVILKYLYPLCIMLFASAVVRDEEVFLKAGLCARWVAVICLIFSVTPGISILVPGVFWYGTARAIHFIPICIFSLALYFYGGRNKKDLLWAVIFAIPCLLWVFRTSIMGTILAVMTFFYFRYRIKSLPIIMGILLLSIIAVFTIPSLKEKMFKTDDVTMGQLQEGRISKDNINSNARFAMWEHLQSRFYTNKQIQGSGTGSVQNYMYTHRIFGGLKVPHNDYVQMLCDNGIIAVIIYILAGLTLIFHALSIYDHSRSSIVQICAITAGSSMTGLLLTLCSDNVVNYSMATLSMPFGFYGMLLGLNKQNK
ncbi:O-antigen ligase family protein [Bacteroides finegoldii]|uniref:O-antigen ligase family protein n=1 Tax=Bacteroides finegoldii TaxID=338188 RepID=UPI0018987C49|nr:O-antigen ligase family protein [Bacteroides finegoldii]